MKYRYLSAFAASLVLGSVHVSAAEPFCSNKTLEGSDLTAKDLGYAPTGFAAVAFYDGKGGSVFTAVNADKSVVSLKGTYQVTDHCRGEIKYSVKDDVRTVAFFIAPSGDDIYFVETGGPVVPQPSQGRILAGVARRRGRSRGGGDPAPRADGCPAGGAG
jgi:hypothetical protein